MLDNRMNRLEHGYQTVKTFCQHGMLIPDPPVSRNASVIEHEFHKMKLNAMVHKPAR